MVQKQLTKMEKEDFNLEWEEGSWRCAWDSLHLNYEWKKLKIKTIISFFSGIASTLPYLLLLLVLLLRLPCSSEPQRRPAPWLLLLTLRTSGELRPCLAFFASLVVCTFTLPWNEILTLTEKPGPIFSLGTVSPICFSVRWDFFILPRVPSADASLSVCNGLHCEALVFWVIRPYLNWPGGNIIGPASGVKLAHQIFSYANPPVPPPSLIPTSWKLKWPKRSV